jgi:hypothetical protein
MRNIILLLMLAAVSSNAMAEWIRVDGDATSTLYYDTSRIIKNDSMVKMWSLINYKTPQALVHGAYMSEMMQDEFNCKDELVRNLYHSYHSDAMGKGDKLLPTFFPEKWSPVEPNSLNESILKLACSKKK